MRLVDRDIDGQEDRLIRITGRANAFDITDDGKLIRRTASDGTLEAARANPRN